MLIHRPSSRRLSSFQRGGENARCGRKKMELAVRARCVTAKVRKFQIYIFLKYRPGNSTMMALWDQRGTKEMESSLSVNLFLLWEWDPPSSKSTTAGVLYNIAQLARD
jgi:hypothetical protein